MSGPAELTALESFSTLNKLAERFLEVSKVEPQKSACKRFTHHFLKPIALHIAFFATSFFAAMADTLVHLGLCLGKAIAILATLPIRFFVKLPKDLDPFSPLVHLLTLVRTIAISPIAPFVGLVRLQKAYELTLIGLKIRQIETVIESKESENKLNSLDNIRVKLEAEIVQLKNELKDTQQLLKAKEDHIILEGDLAIALDATEVGNNKTVLEETLKADREALKNKIIELEAILQARTNKEVELQATKRRLEQLTIDIDAKVRNIQDLEANLETKDQQAFVCNGEIAQLKADKTILETEITLQKNLVLKLQGQKPEVDLRELQDLQKDKVELERQLAQKQIVLLNMQIKIKQLDDSREESLVKKQNLENEFAALKNKYDELENNLHVKAAQFQAAQNELERTKADLKLKEAELKKALEEIEFLKKASQTVIKAASVKRNELEYKIKDLEAQLETTRSEIKPLRAFAAVHEVPKANKPVPASPFLEATKPKDLASSIAQIETQFVTLFEIEPEIAQQIVVPVALPEPIKPNHPVLIEAGYEARLKRHKENIDAMNGVKYERFKQKLRDLHTKLEEAKEFDYIPEETDLGASLGRSTFRDLSLATDKEKALDANIQLFNDILSYLQDKMQKLKRGENLGNFGIHLEYVAGADLPSTQEHLPANYVAPTYTTEDDWETGGNSKLSMSSHASSLDIQHTMGAAFAKGREEALKKEKELKSKGIIQS